MKKESLRRCHLREPSKERCLGNSSPDTGETMALGPQDQNLFSMFEGQQELLRLEWKEKGKEPYEMTAQRQWLGRCLSKNVDQATQNMIKSTFTYNYDS